MDINLYKWDLFGAALKNIDVAYINKIHCFV